MSTPWIPIVNMATVERKANEAGLVILQERWSPQAIDELSQSTYDIYLDNCISEAREAILAQEVAVYLRDHRHKVYLYGHIRGADENKSHYLVYAVDTEIENFLLNPFFSPVNMKRLSPGAFWTKDDEYLHWSHHMTDRNIAKEYMEYGYWVDSHSFVLESIDVPAIYMENNTDKKHFLDKGEF